MILVNLNLDNVMMVPDHCQQVLLPQQRCPAFVPPQIQPLCNIASIQVGCSALLVSLAVVGQQKRNRGSRQIPSS